MKCPNCKGTGQTENIHDQIITCDLCDGWGKIKNIRTVHEECFNCGGEGSFKKEVTVKKTGIHEQKKLKNTPCDICNGRGHIKRRVADPDEGHGESSEIFVAIIAAVAAVIYFIFK